MIPTDWGIACQDCVGRTTTLSDELPPYFANGLLATLNDQSALAAGAPLPALFHWLYFNETTATSQLKSDGHEKLGSFLPPVRYPHRMWAGSDIQFHHQLLLGETTERISTIQSVEFKSGTSGALCFVNVEHRYQQLGKHCLTDIHTIVYREHMARNIPKSVTPGVPLLHKPDTQSLDSIVLFRYSALTFNSHRIHYDHEYCKNIEGYPGIVVHGPLMATLLIRHMQNICPELTISSFSFRAHTPVFEGEEFSLVAETTPQGATASLIKCDGTTAMSSELSWHS